MKFAADSRELYTEAGITPDKGVITLLPERWPLFEAYFTLRLRRIHQRAQCSCPWQVGQ